MDPTNFTQLTRKFRKITGLPSNAESITQEQRAKGTRFPSFKMPGTYKTLLSIYLLPQCLKQYLMNE